MPTLPRAAQRVERMTRPGPIVPAFLLLALLSALPLPVRAQSSLVPAQHAVYDWLHRQRVLGNIDHFPAEALPASRATIERFLHQVAAHEPRLARADRALLHAFLQEFSAAALVAAAEDNWIRGPGPAHRRIARLFDQNAEPHLFAYADSSVRYAIDVLWGFGGMTGSVDRAHLSSLMHEAGFRAFADIAHHVGLHMEAANLAALNDARAMPLDPLYEKTYKVAFEKDSHSFYYETHASARWGPLSLDLGHGALKYGAGRDHTLLVSRDASSFDWLRFGIDTRYFRYTALHGSLAWDDIELIRRGDGITSATAPPRWVVLHRAEAMPWRSFRVAISDMLVYSDRPIDIAYLNPVTPVFLAERGNSQRDNALLAFDVMWQPVRGIELFGALLIDEVLSFGDIVRLGAHGERAFDVGVEAALRSGWDAELRYVRIDPWTWTHNRLNAVEQRGFPLAHPLGPNADSRGIRMRRWFPHRAFIAAGVDHRRKGLNPIDTAGNLIENVGGDITVESRDKRHIPLFHNADLQEYVMWTIGGRVEPWRGVRVDAHYRHDTIRRGTRIPPRRFLDIRLRIGF